MSYQPITNLPRFGDLATRSNLTNSQLLVWLGQRLNPDAPLYNMAMRFDIDGAVEVKAFREAICGVIKDSDTLRSVIEVIDQVPQQRILEAIDDCFEFIDLSGFSDADQRCNDVIERRTGGIIDLSRVNFDCVLIKLGNSRYVWFFSQHHCFTDIASIELIFRQVSNRYLENVSAEASASTSEATILPQFESYRTAEKLKHRDNPAPREDSSTHPSTPIGLYHFKSGSRDTRAYRVQTQLGEVLTQQLHALAQRQEFSTLSLDLSVFNLVATAFFAFLHRISDSEELAIGCPVHNRSTIDLKNTIGLFIEVFPLDVSVDPEDTFVTLHDKVSAATFQHLKSATVANSEVGAVRGYNVIFNYITAQFQDFGPHPCRTDWLHNDHIDPQHDLRLQLFDLCGDGDLRLCFDIKHDTLNETRGKDALFHFVNVLKSLLSDPGQSISTVKLAGDTESQKLLHRFWGYNQSTAESEHALYSESVVDRFRHQVNCRPDAPAVINQDRSISYSELDHLSNMLAYRVLNQVNTPKLIGVCAARSVELLVAFISVHKAGAAFVPLDPANPDARLRQICTNADIKLLLCHSDQNHRLADICDTVINIDHTDPDFASQRLDVLPEISPEDDAYVIFTSGSTGEPKGVVVRQGALGDYIQWAAQTYCGVNGQDAEFPVPREGCDFPLYSSIGFDLTLTSVFVPLSIGGCIRIYPDDRSAMDLSITKVVQDDVVDVIKLTPAHLSLLTGMNLSTSRVHTLILGGEDLTTSLAQQTQRIFGPGIRVFNEYGPTEAVVGCMLHQYKPGEDNDVSVPIGHPAEGVNIYLLDSAGNPVPEGVTGEIYIGGRRLASGYLRQPDMTADRFIPDPFLPDRKMYRTGDLARVNRNRQLVYLGRKDNQLKIRGVRIEIAEISQAVKSHPLIKDCHIGILQDNDLDTFRTPHYCASCGLASNYPGVSFDDAGLCNHCQDFNSYRNLAAEYFRSLPELQSHLVELSKPKRGRYDCMMLLSGGKDSTYALYQICAMDLNVFAMTLDNGYISEGAKANIRRSVADLGIEHEFVTTDSMNEIFSDSLNRHSSVCYGCFKTIYTLAINHAHKLGIPVIVTGLSRGQMFETRLTRQVFEQSEFDPESIDREVLEARKVYHRIPDKVTECLDMSLFASDQIFDEINFVDFYRYCDVSMGEMYAFLEQHAPWTRPEDTGRSTNCLINDTGIFVHKQKMGYHNYALPYSWDVRLGHKQRNAALEELNDQIDANRVHEILQEISYDDGDLLQGTGHHKMVAYCTGNELIGTEELKSYLRSRLPEAMVPSYFVLVDSIPLTANGKVDQNALPDPRNERPKLDQVMIPATTETEKMLSKIWCDALRINQVGIHDNFFDLGGDSIVAIQIVVRAGQKGMSLTPNQLFLHQTIEKLALAVGSKGSTGEQQQSADQTPFSLLNHDEDTLKNLSSLLDT